MRVPRTRAAFLLLLLVTTPAGAQQVVTSAGPDRVSVTLYRNPARSSDEEMDAEWLGGFALISETRRVTIPAGETQLRFEGVAGGIVPQSAIVTGLPEGIVERNRDAMLLSPESLLDRSLGRRVRLRRTSSATGAVIEQEAVIRTGADGAVVLQTAAGYEALRCTGLPETLVYDGVPEGLSARPTLSVRTRASRPVTATVTLSYLATGFDWQANYVARLTPDGAHVDLFAWLVLASSDQTSFADADTQAVAGRLRYNTEPEDLPDPRALQLRCWPQSTTSDIPMEQLPRFNQSGDGFAVSPVTVVNAQEIRLRGVTRTEDLIDSLPQAFASQEGLGDLKLYRLPTPVTVAARSLKQVAFLERSAVPVEIVHRHAIYPDEGGESQAQIMLITRNREAEQLGIPLPAGRVQLFRDQGDRSLLLGEGDVPDYAVGENVEIAVGEAPGVISRITAAPNGRDYLLTVTNDQSYPIRFEAMFRMPASDVRARGATLGRRNGFATWLVAVPPNGSATLRYRLPRSQED